MTNDQARFRGCPILKTSWTPRPWFRRQPGTCSQRSRHWARSADRSEGNHPLHESLAATSCLFRLGRGTSAGDAMPPPAPNLAKVKKLREKRSILHLFLMRLVARGACAPHHFELFKSDLVKPIDVCSSSLVFYVSIASAKEENPNGSDRDLVRRCG